MTLKTVMDRLGLTAAEVGAALERTAQNVRQMRLDPGHVNYRPPPAGWQRRLAALARARAKIAVKLAEQLERDAGGEN
jgi:hypothetical protein